MYEAGIRKQFMCILCLRKHAQASRKSLAEWQQEVSRKLANVSTLIVKSYIKYSYFSIGREDAR